MGWIKMMVETFTKTKTKAKMKNKTKVKVKAKAKTKVKVKVKVKAKTIFFSNTNFPTSYDTIFGKSGSHPQ